MLFIPFPPKSLIGGPSTFMRNLKSYLKDIGWAYSSFLSASNTIFFPIQYDIKKLQKFKDRGGRIIQRLDGIYYPSQHGDRYKLMNQAIQEIYLKHVDFVVFQSRYSKKQCFEMMGEVDNYEIIINGTDKSLFYPAEKAPSTGKKRFRFVTTGSFRKKAMIEPIVNALDSLKGEFDFELLTIGPIIEKEIEVFFNRKYIRHFGQKSSGELADLIRECDIFIHSQLNDNCPNATLEAISCGLPIVGFESGGMPELCQFSNELLAYVSEDTFQKYEDFDYHKLIDKIRLCVENFDHYKELALLNSHLYDFRDCGDQYLKVFENQISLGNPVPWPYKMLNYS